MQRLVSLDTLRFLISPKLGPNVVLSDVLNVFHHFTGMFLNVGSFTIDQSHSDYDIVTLRDWNYRGSITVPRYHDFYNFNISPPHFIRILTAGDFPYLSSEGHFKPYEVYFPRFGARLSQLVDGDR